jgi:hypothetical protein
MRTKVFFRSADQISMKILILIICILISLTACGVDPLSKPAATNTSALVAVSGVNGTQCSCNTVFSPVCSSDGKSYDNICIAKCMGSTQSTQGHCQCQPTLMVCGSDGVTYNECDAIQFRIPITKFVACNKQPL